MGHYDDFYNEEIPRNAAAIRTAILLGAEFVLDVGGMWQVKGIDLRSKNKTMPAFMYLIPYGIGITKDARACLFKDILEENSK
jgi:hypothetical protein